MRSFFKSGLLDACGFKPLGAGNTLLPSATPKQTEVYAFIIMDTAISQFAKTTKVQKPSAQLSAPGPTLQSPKESCK